MPLPPQEIGREDLRTALIQLQSDSKINMNQTSTNPAITVTRETRRSQRHDDHSDD